MHNAHSHPNRGSKCMFKLLKNGHILIKNVLLKINFQDEGHLDANFLIYILTIYCECLLFQFFNRDVRMHIPVLTGVQNGYISRRKKQSYFAKKCSF